MIDFSGIRVPISTIEQIRERGPISREEYKLLQGTLPVRLGGIFPPSPISRWPIYQASGYGEVFMYDQNERLRWFPNYETLQAYGYTGAERKIVPISWFYDKPIVGSIKDVRTGTIYPAEETPNYLAYIKAPDIGIIYRCPQCGKVFPSQLELAQHIQQVHGPYLPYQPPPPPEEPEVIRPEVVREVTCPQCGSILGALMTRPPVLFLPTITLKPLKCPVCGQDLGINGYAVSVKVRMPWPPFLPWPTYKCEVCGDTFPSLDALVRHIAEEHKPVIPLTTIACPQCKSTLQIVPPSLEKMVTQAFTWLSCPVCGYPKLFYAPTGGYTVSVKVREPWPPVTYLPPAPPEKEPLVTPPDKYPPTWPIEWLPPEIIEITEGAPPTDYIDTIGLPEGIPVEEKLAYWVEEPKLAEAEAPVVSWAKKNWLPLTVIGGLGATAMGVYLKKRKKRS